MATLANFARWALLTTLIAGCSAAAPVGPRGPGAPEGAPGSPDRIPPGGAAGSIDACTLLTDAEIEAAADERVTERRQSTLTQVFPSVCDIPLDQGGSLTVGVLAPGGRSMYEASFEPFIGEGDFAPLEEVVTGLGDKAARSGESQLMVLKDDVLFDIHFIGARPDKLPAVRYLAERILARLPCIATGCPDMPLPPAPTVGPPTPAPTAPAIDPGALPPSGGQVRVVNLYSEDGQPVDIDVYGSMWSEAELSQVGVRLATVPYGQASAWFDPGLIQSPFGSEPSTVVEIFRAGDRSEPLAAVSEFLGEGRVTTIAVWQDEVFEGQPGAWTQTIYALHPDYPIPEAPAGQGLLISRDAGLQAEAEPPILFASVGDGCLESPVGRSDPDIPNAQPLGNDLVIPVGGHTLTVHESPPGQLPTCETKALGPGAPLNVAAGDRWLAFPYRLPGGSDVDLLVIPFDGP